MDIKDSMAVAVGTVSRKSGTGSGNSSYLETDLVPLYGSNGELRGKIARSDLMDCVRDSLGTLLADADQATTGVRFPSINSSNVLGSMTAANLASLLWGIVCPSEHKGDY